MRIMITSMPYLQAIFVPIIGYLELYQHHSTKLLMSQCEKNAGESGKAALF
jgi:hypothetical protein